MSKNDIAWMGYNLGFIQTVILVDGTIVDNTQVLDRSPIPSRKELELIFKAANEESVRIMGPATKEWSWYPEFNQHVEKKRGEIQNDKLDYVGSREQ